MASLPFNLGALQIGFSISTLLFGFTTVQFYYYLRHFPEDSRYLKSLSGAYHLYASLKSMLAEVGHQICLSHIGHWFLVINHGNTRVLDGPQPLSIAFSVFFVAVISFLVQAFFAFRLWKVTKRTALVYVLHRHRSDSVSIAIDFGFPEIQASRDPNLGLQCEPHIHGSHEPTISSLSPSTSKLIDRAIITVVAGFATKMIFSDGICAISITICYLTMENLVWTAIFMVIPRFFSNSMLTS
ncbi:hypothetical protein FPV67DRAFT_1446393 [Lyophyllum atratum]|nr:hypothetical protein FPV67DRAFT_1446393 [Lyophyllum atratum]